MDFIHNFVNITLNFIIIIHILLNFFIAFFLFIEILLMLFLYLKEMINYFKHKCNLKEIQLPFKNHQNH
jgi:cytochrome b subunit of formate dehydrogenase